MQAYVLCEGLGVLIRLFGKISLYFFWVGGGRENQAAFEVNSTYTVKNVMCDPVTSREAQDVTD
jgi:hypothetical protein